jgi:hypothetical protein
MVQDVSERRLVILFTEGLSEPLKGWIKAFDPPSLQEAMKKARGMEFAAPKSKSLHKEIPSTSNETLQQSDKKEKSAPMMDEETQEELKKKKLCYWCKEPYNRDHDCPLRPKGKANRFMWAYYEDSDSDEADRQAISDVYMVRNAHNFIFDSHAHDLFMMHNSRAHSWGDSLSCVKFGGKDDQSLGLLPLQAYTSTTLGDDIALIRPNSDGIALVRPNNRLFEKMLQELFGDDMDIMQFFLWDPGGELLEDKQF